MPRARPPHLHRQITRHGKAVWYVRLGHGSRIRVRADYGSPAFDEEYRAAIAGAPRHSRSAIAPGSLAWLLERYRETQDWLNLSKATRRQRDNIFRGILETAGREPYRSVTAAVVAAGREPGALPRQPKPATTWTPSAASLGGHAKPASCRRIRRSA